jgi:8-amino-7-oxononanoate synthase
MNLNFIAAKLQNLKDNGLYRTRVQADSGCKPLVETKGRTRLAFNSNDYLGLASDPRVIEAFKEGVSLYGVGSGASHLISGHGKAHALLEERLSQLMSPMIPNAAALYFCSGYMANLAVVTSLVSGAEEGVTIFSEELNHASIIDAIRLCKAPFVVYPHCDTQALGQMLRESKSKTKLVLTDGVFSMDGDIAPLLKLVAMCEREGAWLVVDDAHGFGVLGQHGLGALEHFGISSSHVIYMGTLGKAAGVCGAFVSAHATMIDWMIQRARPYIYTTAAPPACAHALLKSVDLITGSEGAKRREHLHNLLDQFKQQISSSQHFQYKLLESDTPIQPLVIGSNEDVLNASKSLLADGVWVSAIRAPTVPVGTARLRLTLSASHTADQVDQLTRALKRL